MSVHELSQELGVSEVTIRKDLNLLCKRNLVIRTHGGAMLGGNPVATYEDVHHAAGRRLFNYREKRAIGKLAASLIEEGDTIMLDSGTTTQEIAHNLRGFENLTIITNAVNVVAELMACKRFNVILLGGNLHEPSQSTVGAMTENNLRMLFCDKLFLGVDSFNVEEGISTPNIDEANINQMMIQRAKQVIAVFDSSKVNKRSLAFIAPLECIHTIVSDGNMPTSVRRRIEEAGVTLHIASDY